MAALKAPLLIAHRGASGYMPEHTLAGYSLAILQGADFIEPDLVATRDGVLVARHENEIGGTTDVATNAEFSERRRTQSVDGEEITGWFIEDFTLAELKTLRARERIPQLRPQNTQYDGRLEVPTFDEILSYLSSVNAIRAAAGLAPVGVYPETKHPSHFAAIGLALEPPLLDALKKGLAIAPVFIQCFEVGNLRALRRQCAYPLVQLMSADGGPWDGAREGATYQAMATAEGLRHIAEYASAIGVEKKMLIAEQVDGTLRPTSLIGDAHARELDVHAWTFRAENNFLPKSLQQSLEPAAHGDLSAEIRMHLANSLDGLFCDFPDIARKAIDDFTAVAVKNPNR